MNTENEAAARDNVPALIMRRDGIAGLQQVGEYFAKSGLLGVTTKEQGVIVAMTCAQEGISPFDFKRRYHIINNNLAMRYDAMLAEFKLRGGRVRWITRTDRECTAEFSLGDESLRESFTLADAERAGLVRAGGGWTKYPKNMLTARCVSNALRLVCPQIVAGIYTPEEVRDFDDAPPRTLPRAAPPPPPSSPSADEPREAEARVVPESDPAEPPVAAAAERAETAPDDDPVARIRAILKGEEFEAVAVDYLRSLRWLEAGQGLGDLPRDKAHKVLARFGDFWKRADEHHHRAEGTK